MDVRLQIRLFGSPEIRRGELCAGRFPTEKVKLLFAYLALFRHDAYPRPVLAGLLWGEDPEVNAHHSLSTALWRLRQWINPFQVESDPYVLSENGQIAFNRASAYWLDVAEFEQRVSWARKLSASAPVQAAAFLTQAIELYRGDLLEGCYMDWCLAKRDELRELYLQALLQLMVYHGGRRAYPQAIDFGQRLVRLEPLREEVHREIMKLFVLNGQPTEALRQYRRCQATLREELGIEPMPETQEVFRKVIHDTAAATYQASIVFAGAPRDVRGQLQPTLESMEATLQYFDAARAELAQTIEVLKQIRDQAQGR